MGAHRKQKLTYEQIIAKYREFFGSTATDEGKNIRIFAHYCGMSRDTIATALLTYRQEQERQKEQWKQHQEYITENTIPERCMKEFIEWAKKHRLLYPDGTLTLETITNMIKELNQL